MERVELLPRTGKIAVATGYAQLTVNGEYRIYPAKASRDRWLGPNQRVRFLDGREATLVVTESRVRQLTWLTAREV